MCRLLAVTAAEPVAMGDHLRALARIARHSREYQGHGWGCAWDDDGAWRTYHRVTPIWEEDLSGFGRARTFVAHARSAFRDEGIDVANNMPFVAPPFVFVFNGELRGVRIAEQGRIGAEKLFRYLVRLGAGHGDAEARTAVRLVGQRTRYVRAMNFVLAGSRRFVVHTAFNEDPDYFTLHARRTPAQAVICSEPYDAGGGGTWTPLPNGSLEVWPWYS